MRRLIVALCSVALLIAVAAPAASATLPQRVTITSDMTLSNLQGHSYGTFEATGPAVTRHLICPTGDVRDIYLLEVPGGWDVVKAFVCADGSQSFIVRLQVKVNEDRIPSHSLGPSRAGPARTAASLAPARGTSTPWVDPPGS